VLIVDDEPAARELLRETLAEAGYETVEAADGPGALREAARERPHVALLDVRMPGMNGMEALRLLREMDPGIGVIVITAAGDEGMGREALRRGAFDYLTKPLDLDSLRRSLWHLEILPPCTAAAARPGACPAPVGRGQAEQAAGSEGSVSSRRAPGDPPSVLVVDDDPSAREMLREMLANAGYRVRVGTSGMTALLHARSELPDCVLLDIQMSGMSGLEACRRLRAAAGDALPILLVTAASDSIDAQAMEACGADDLVAKPVREEELLDRIRDALDLQRRREELTSASSAIERLERRQRDHRNAALATWAGWWAGGAAPATATRDAAVDRPLPPMGPDPYDP
jgi:CheY-like chemotaxis protein